MTRTVSTPVGEPSGATAPAAPATPPAPPAPVPAAAPAVAAPSGRPPLVRPRSGRMLAGVAAGTAAHLGADPLLVRALFLALAVTGVGLVVYPVLWFFMPLGETGQDVAPQPSRRQTAAMVLLGLGALVLVTNLATWGSSELIGPLLLVAGGLAVIWRQLDTDRTLARPGVRWVLAGGALLAAIGVVLLLATTGQLAAARNGFVATVVILVGVVLATAPFWRRLLDSREVERTARIRSEERAAVAAHLHDSVLQTLALIQRHAGDQQAVARLARSQERELRTWLYEPRTAAGGTWAGLVSDMVAEVEGDHALTVDPVVVGDAPVDDALAALGAATREALVNAAKHAGVSSADLYTEVTPAQVSVFVRDRGAGFDPATVPADRRGLRDSVTSRVIRLGGTATVRSAPGEGTEVELVLPREDAA
ncbi:phage shock protein C (PspC) family protein [Geodermatophilus saharensis]|uniref:Phage shock protein C (PspC) family protein n=1 Tax=Geodermatophilus saharensis TaxID=1137994 RepID=A0A238ZUJ6_9ACTN|nr:ATP-binding protein [Geodermatophilus saharensis]SNR86802.1 phage shock protein C (PspC) family protein [Geodermatophilus saharensis]